MAEGGRLPQESQDLMASGSHLDDDQQHSGFLLNQQRLLNRIDQESIHEKIDEFKQTLSRHSDRLRQSKTRDGKLEIDGKTASSCSSNRKTEKMSLLRQQVEENKLKLAERDKHVKDLEDFVSELQQQQSSTNSTSAEPLMTVSSNSIWKESYSSEQIQSVLHAKEKRIHQLEMNVIDLQDNLKEKDSVIDARTKAISLLTENLTRKSKSAQEALEETRQEMRAMQQNFVQLETEMHGRQLNLLENLKEKRREIEQLEETVEQLKREVNSDEKLIQLERENHELRTNYDTEQLRRQLDELNRNLIKLKVQHKNKVKDLMKKIEYFTSVADVNAELVKIETEVCRLNEKNAELEMEKGAFQLKLIEAPERIAHLEATLQEKSYEMEMLKKENTNLLNKVEKLSSAESIEIVEELTQQEKLEMEAYDKDQEEKQLLSDEEDLTRIHHLDETVSELAEEMSDLVQKIDKVTLERQELTEKVAELTSENQRLHHQVEQLQRTQQEFIPNSESLMEQHYKPIFTEIQAKFAGFQQKLSHLEAANASNENFVETLQQENCKLHELREENESTIRSLLIERDQLPLLTENKQQMDSLIRQNRDQLEKMKILAANLKRKNCDCLDLEGQLTAIREQSRQKDEKMTDLIQNCDESEKEILHLQESLRHYNELVDNVRELKGNLVELEHQNVVLQDNLIVYRENSEKNIVAIQQELFKANSSTEIQELQELRTAIQRLVNEIPPGFDLEPFGNNPPGIILLESRLMHLLEHYRNQEARLQELLKENDQLDEKCRKVSTDMQANNVQLEKVKNEYNGLLQENQRIMEDFEEFLKDKQVLQIKCQQLEQALETANQAEENPVLTKKLKTLEFMLYNAETEKEELLKQCEKLTCEIAEFIFERQEEMKETPVSKPKKPELADYFKSEQSDFFQPEIQEGEGDEEERQDDSWGAWDNTDEPIIKQQEFLSQAIQTDCDVMEKIAFDKLQMDYEVIQKQMTLCQQQTTKLQETLNLELLAKEQLHQQLNESHVQYRCLQEAENDDLTALNQNCKDLRAQIEQDAATIHTLNQHIYQLEQEEEQTNANRELQWKLEELSSENANLQLTLQRAGADLEVFTKENFDLRSKLEQFEQIHQDLNNVQGENDRLQELVRSKIVDLNVCSKEKLQLEVNLEEFRKKIKSLQDEYENNIQTICQQLTSEWQIKVDERGANVAESWKLHLEARESEFGELEERYKEQLRVANQENDAKVQDLHVKMAGFQRIHNLITASQVFDPDEPVDCLITTVEDLLKSKQLLNVKIDEITVQRTSLKQISELLNYQEQNSLIDSLKDLISNRDHLEQRLKHVHESLTDKDTQLSDLNQRFIAICKKNTEILQELSLILNCNNCQDSCVLLENLRDQLLIKNNLEASVNQLHQDNNKKTLILQEISELLTITNEEALISSISDLISDRDDLQKRLLQIEDVQKVREVHLEQIEVQRNTVKNLLMISQKECSEAFENCTKLRQDLVESNRTLNDFRQVFDEQKVTITKLEEDLVEKSKEFDSLVQSQIEEDRRIRYEKHRNQQLALESENSEGSAKRAELDLALYMLHQRDVRCEELTVELTQLLEERDVLQLKLSNVIREKEDLTQKLTTILKCSSESSIFQPIVNLTTASSAASLGSGPLKEGLVDIENEHNLKSKLTQLKTVGYRKDKTIVDEQEWRRLQELSIFREHKQAAAKLPPEAAARLIDATYTLSRDTETPSRVLLNWLWGKGTPKVDDI